VRNEHSELKEIIDQRTPEERKWMTAYLLDGMFAAPELRQTAQELSELARRRGDLLVGVFPSPSRSREVNSQLLMVRRAQTFVAQIAGLG
jgi:hypothetical protein